MRRADVNHRLLPDSEMLVGKRQEDLPVARGHGMFPRANVITQRRLEEPVGLGHLPPIEAF